MRSFFHRSKETDSAGDSPISSLGRNTASPQSDKMIAAVEQTQASRDDPSTPTTQRSHPGDYTYGASGPVTPRPSAGPVTPATSPGMRCKKCGSEGTNSITREGRRTGNGGRPFSRCEQHGFIGWLDNRGIHADNPVCDCGRPSRRGVAGPEKGRRIFLTCAEGRCEFYQQERRGDGEVWHCTDENMVELLRRLQLI
jgi:hypothetical protein